MKKQKKQNLLTVIIIILGIVLAMLVGSIVYEEMINMNKQTQNTLNPTINQDEENNSNKENETAENEDEIQGENKNESEVEEEEKIETTDKEPEYVGEEESDSQEETTENKDDKAIQLVKKEWGEDKKVTFSIEKKNGTKYRVAVRDNSTIVLAWYEVDTETWEVSEY